jgi:hypothetical protein
MDDHSGSASRQRRSAAEAPAGEPLLRDRAVTDDDGLGPPGSRRLTDQEKVVRAFLRDGRLVSIPARTGKRDLLLPVILDRCFPEDRAYEEKEVNMRLALLHPDVAALRRYLVEGGLMSREAGIYRRVRPPG